MSISSLACSRRLWPLCVAQALCAFEDNLVRNALIILAMGKMGLTGAGFAALAGAIFMVPYLFLSALGGRIADRFPKDRVIVKIKAAEVVLMGCAATGLVLDNLPLLLVTLFGLGAQAALFGPVKYGILPQHLAEDELVAGNAIVEATTFFAILSGTITGGGLVLLPRGEVIVSAVGMTSAIVGLLAARAVLPAAAADPGSVIGWNVFSSTMDVIRAARAVRPGWLSILGLSWFWTIGATLMAEFPSLVHDSLGAEPQVVTLLLAFFATGIGVGSLACARLLRGEVSPRYVPFAAVGMSVACLDLSRAFTHAPHLANVAAMLHSLAGMHILADLAVLAALGGIYSVPLYAIMQETAPPAGRARIISANNIMNAVFMVAGAAAAGALAHAGYSAASVVGLLGVVNMAVALWIIRILPHEIYRVAFRWFFTTFHGVEVAGLENYKAAGDRLVIVSNHTSYEDAALIAAFLPGQPTFAIHTNQTRKWWVRIFTAAVRIFPVDLQNPFAIKTMIEAVRDHGKQLVIFPEGRLTKTGSLMKIYEGAGVVADKAGARVLPITIQGLQYSPLGHMAGKLRQRMLPRLKLVIHPAVDLTPPDAAIMTPRQRRQAVGNALQDVMIMTGYRARNIRKTLFEALLDAAQVHGRGMVIVEDVNRQPLTYGRLIMASAALGRRLARITPPDPGTAVPAVGIMMPNAIGTLVAFLGLQAFGRVPAMLNFSAGAEGMLSACTAAKVSTVISSRAFVEKAKLGRVVDMMSNSVRFVWLEDVKAGIGLSARIRAKWDSIFARRLPGATANPDAPAVIIYTSGSEDVPKGVVHSHSSILANCAQLASVIDFNSADVVMNALPIFHSFGMTGGTLLPLLNGVRAFHYPSPLHYRIVPALIYDTDATICFGTDTFLRGWARYAHPYDFYQVRYIFAGAEKIQDTTKRLYAERFGVRILEGYGATETAPVLATNTAMHSRSGSVGRLLPDVESRLEPVPGIDGGGQLFVRGPNLMLGYMRVAAPGVIEKIPDGWYDTGDIVAIDASGFVDVVGRIKRFANIGGEKVSMSAVEKTVSQVWPDDVHAVVAQPCPRKGQKLLLVTTRRDADMKELLAAARERGVAEIAVPRQSVFLSAIPLLGAGKVDYPAVARLLAALSAGGAEQEPMAA